MKVWIAVFVVLSLVVRGDLTDNLEYDEKESKNIKMEAVDAFNNEVEDMKMENVSPEEIKLEPINLDIQGTNYVSDEVKDAENFKKFYDNNYIYVSFRDKFIAHSETDISESYSKETVRAMFTSVLEPVL
jgi:hypothetical protein